MICVDVERDLDEYVDGELEPEATAAVHEHLTSCQACRQRVTDRETLRRLVRGAPYYQAPARLRHAVASQAQRPSSARRMLGWAAAAAIIIALVGSALVLNSRARLQDQLASAAVEEVVSDHVRSLMSEHLFDVRSTDQHTVKPWFLGKLDFSPPVTDLASVGFPLAGGRLEYLGGRPAAALVYSRGQHTINVFVWPDASRDAAPEARSLRGFHTLHWVRNGMSFWAVSDLNEGELSQFVRALQAAS